LSAVQIAGTAASIKLVHETRDEMQQMKEETADQLRQAVETQERAQETLGKNAAKA